MRNNVVMSSLRQGINGYAANSGDAASLINLASNSSYSKMRLSWGASSTIATTFLPVMHTVLMAMLVGLFPIIILLAMIHTLTMPMLKNFVFTLLYLQMWPPLFAILNYVMSYHLQGQTKEMDFSLSNVAYIQQMHSDIGLMAGWLTLSIPFIAAGVVSGLWRVVSQAGNYLGTATNSSTSSSASQAADGTWAFNNMQMDNVAGHKWDTNQSFRTGQQTTQHASGATSSRTQSGETVYDSSTAQSKLPTDIQFSKALSSGYQAQAREAMSQVQSLTQSMGQSSSLASSQMAQWSQQRGSSDTLTTGTDSSRSSNFTDAVNKLNSITARHAKDNNISQAESLQAGVTKSQSGNFSVGGQVHGKVDTDKQIIGKLAQWGTGWSVGAEAHVKGDYTGSSGSSHGIQSDTSNRTSYSKDYSAQDLKDIRQATDVIASYRTTEGSSHSQNESGSLANQMSSTFSNLQSQSTQYNDAQNRSHEYAQMATYAENNSASINSNYAQEFVGYVHSFNGARANEILTNTASPTVRAEREQLAQQFVEERLKPQLEQKFQENRGRANEVMGGIANPSGMQSNLSGDFAQQQQGMERTASEAGVGHADSTVRKVQENRQNATQQIDNAAQLVADSQQGVAQESIAAQQGYQDQIPKYNAAKVEEQERQKFKNLSTADQRAKLNEINEDIMSSRAFKDEK
jgi:conjugal transfer mating pair stabilization protein TraG